MFAIVARYDLVIHDTKGDYPSWVEFSGITGRFTGEVGSARVIAEYERNDVSVYWKLPKQYEGRETDLEFRGTVNGREISGTFLNSAGEWVPFSGVEAPELPYRAVEWGDEKDLLADGLAGWVPRSPDWENNWSITENGLENAKVGSDIVTSDKFTDFRLTTEYRYPAGSNSGIYLHGRYEFQILDDFGAQPTVGSSGAIYGLLVPAVNAVNPPNEWNTAVIELVGRFVTVTLNGVVIHDRAEIAGPTGGALDSNEGEPGPLFLQGDHGPVTFRRVLIQTPK
jgi:hypothetical protein